MPAENPFNHYFFLSVSFAQQELCEERRLELSLAHPFDDKHAVANARKIADTIEHTGNLTIFEI